VNKDQVEGKAEQAVGSVKQAVGEAIGSENLADRGVLDKAKGAAQETWGNVKDAAKEIQKTRENDAAIKASSRRDDITQSIQNATEKANQKIEEFKERHSA
jgi:uncharacterized protein YjbJ (UPF0337 family)